MSVWDLQITRCGDEPTKQPLERLCLMKVAVATMTRLRCFNSIKGLGRGSKGFKEQWFGSFMDDRWAGWLELGWPDMAAEKISREKITVYGLALMHVYEYGLSHRNEREGGLGPRQRCL